ncbi:MAG: hypothetical protein EXR62_16530 [Chloroflexi bacterium]|nr:hypothetical protein [Chloroflexota bacterium]
MLPLLLINILPSALIIIGFAIILAKANIFDYLHHKVYRHWRYAWGILKSDLGVRLAAALCCIGLFLAGRSWVERGLGISLLIGIGYDWWRVTKQGQQLSPSLDKYLNHSSSNVATTKYPSYFPPILINFGILLERFRPIWVGMWALAFVFTEGRDFLDALGSLAIVWIFIGVTTGQWGRRLPGDWCLAIWLLLIPVTLKMTVVPVLTHVYLSYFMAQIVVFYTVAIWARDKRRIMLMSWGLMGVAVALAVLTPGSIQQKQLFFHLPTLLRTPLFLLPRVINPNVMGGILVVLLPLSFGLVLAQQKQLPLYWIRLILALTGVIMVLAGLLVTQSRGAYAAGILSLLTIVLLRWPQARKLVIGALIGLILVGFFWYDSLLVFITEILNTDAITSLDERVEIWSHAIYAIQDFPLTGIGMGTFSRVIPFLYPYVLLPSTTGIAHAHNLFLQAGVDLGIPGLITFLALFFSLATIGFAAWRRRQKTLNSEMQGVILGCLGALVAMLVHGMLDAVTWNFKPAFVVWAVLGLLSAVGQLAIERD